MNSSLVLRALAISIGLFAMGLSQGCSRHIPPQEACNFVLSPKLQRVSWEKRLPVKLFVHNSVPTEAYAAIDRAIAEYNQALGREMFRIIARGTSGPLTPSRDGSSVIYWFEKWDPEESTEQARTTIYWSGSQIFETDIRINGSLKYHFDESTDISGKVDLISLMVHELGHALGLAHTEGYASVMNSHLAVSQLRRTLNKSDLENLRCEY